MLPVLTVNRSFMHDFMDAEPPCGALGLVEENGRQSGFVALHLDADIPSEVTARGFRLGHSLLGGDAFEVIHLAFAFYGFRTWNVLEHIRKGEGKTLSAEEMWRGLED